MIAVSSSSPATRIDFEKTMPLSEMIAISVVPPPTSTIMLAAGSSIGRPTPLAAAIGSRLVITFRAPPPPAAARGGGPRGDRDVLSLSPPRGRARLERDGGPVPGGDAHDLLLGD